MNYLDVYYARVNHLGETPTEIAYNSNIRSFERWLAGSPFTVENLSVERGLYFSGIIQTSKDKAEQKLMYLYVANDIPIQVGDILTWIQDNGATEKWLLLQKIHDVHEAYQTFQMVKCNYELKWIDADGYLHKSWAYAVSSVDAMIKGNFRMWHSLVSPQPNKYAEIIMPRPLLEGSDRDQLLRGTIFIIENEGWVVIECDWTSVEGVIYMSLTESKVNYEYDDRNIDVADTDKYKFPTLPTLYRVGDKIEPQFEAGTLNQWEIELIKPEDCTFINDNFVAIAPGQCMVTMRLKNRPAVTHNVEITINAVEEESLVWIEGPSELRLDRYADYTLQTNTVIEDLSKVKIEIQSAPSDKDSIRQAADNKFILHANAKNKLGQLVLVASYDGVECATKTVDIIPLW